MPGPLLPALAALLAAAPPPSCARVARPLFEFEVERPATYAGDPALLPRPMHPQPPPPLPPDALLVQFVVDTLGAPDAATFRALRSPDRAAAEEARAALPRWRFEPATRRGCRVPQVVQTVVER